jgi:hypothetical protein
MKPRREGRMLKSLNRKRNGEYSPPVMGVLILLVGVFAFMLGREQGFSETKTPEQKLTRQRAVGYHRLNSGLENGSCRKKSDWRRFPGECITVCTTTSGMAMVTVHEADDCKNGQFDGLRPTQLQMLQTNLNECGIFNRWATDNQCRLVCPLGRARFSLPQHMCDKFADQPPEG